MDGAFVANDAADNGADNTVAGGDDAANGGSRRATRPIDRARPPAGVDLANPHAASAATWPDDEPGLPRAELAGFGHVRSEITSVHARDGLSNTCLIGERYVSPTLIELGTAASENESWVQGTNNDTLRTGGWPPMQDRPGYDDGATRPFDGPRAGTFAMAFAGGSVRWLDRAIEPTVHATLSNHKDRGVAGVVAN